MCWCGRRRAFHAGHRVLPVRRAGAIDLDDWEDYNVVKHCKATMGRVAWSTSPASRVGESRRPLLRVNDDPELLCRRQQ